MENKHKISKERMPGETKEGGGRKRREYGITDLIEKVIEKNGHDAIRDWEKTKDFVRECCKTLGTLWGLAPLEEFIQSEIFFNRVVEIIVKMSNKDDSEIKRIMNKKNKGKDITKEQSDKLNEFIKDLLKKGKPQKEQEKIETEYEEWKEKLDKFKAIKGDMKKKFFESYDKYIDEVLNLELNLKKFNTEEHLKEIFNTNEEILKLIDIKTNRILYKNEHERIIWGAFGNKDSGEKIEINKLAEMIREIGELYGVDSTKDINELADLEKI